MYLKKQIFILSILLSLFIPSSALLTRVIFADTQMVYAQASGAILTNDGKDFYGDNDDSSNLSAGMKSLVELLDEGQLVFQILIGIGLATSTLAFVINAFKLGKSGDAKGRAETTKNLIIISITTACLSGFSFVYQIVVSMILG